MERGLSSPLGRQGASRLAPAVPGAGARMPPFHTYFAGREASAPLAPLLIHADIKKAVPEGNPAQASVCIGGLSLT